MENEKPLGDWTLAEIVYACERWDCSDCPFQVNGDVDYDCEFEISLAHIDLNITATPIPR